MKVIDERLFKARKEHRCQSGHSVIKKGDTYRGTTIVWDGRIYTFKQCTACDDAMKWSDRKSTMNEEEAFPEGWAQEDGVGCAEVKKNA